MVCNFASLQHYQHSVSIHISINNFVRRQEAHDSDMSSRQFEAPSSSCDVTKENIDV